MPNTAFVKHVVPPATSAQIAEAVGVTEEDRRVVDEVLRSLGYVPGRRTGARFSRALKREIPTGQPTGRGSS